jgi:hypothetical protein
MLTDSDKGRLLLLVRGHNRGPIFINAFDMTRFFFLMFRAHPWTRINASADKRRRRFSECSTV